MRTRFVAGQAGTLRFVPPEAAAFGAPSAATVTIRQADGRDLPTPVAGASAALDAVSTTLAADAAVGARSLGMASIAGLVAGRPYLVTSADGERVLLEVAGAAGAAALLADPLPRAFASGDALVGVELSYALAGAQLVDPVTRPGHLYRAVWSYVIAGVTYQADQLFEVRKRALRPTLTEAEVGRYLPARVDELMDGGPRALRAVMGEAWDDVLDDASARGYEPDKIMDCDRLRRPHRSRTLAVLAASWGPAWKDWATERAAEYGRDLDTALNAGDWYDAAEDALQAADEVKVTTVRLTR